MTDPTDVPTWREKTACRILLMIAKMIAPSAMADDIQHLSNHITQAKGAR